MVRPINIEPIRQRDMLLCDPLPETAAHDRRLLLAHFDALVDAARDVAHRGPKCDCELCEDAFDRLRDMLPHEHTSSDSVSVVQYKPCEICTTQSWCETHGCQCYPVSAVQPERCCLDYPRCDCNSPPEQDDDWLCFQRPTQPKVTP